MRLRPMEPGDRRWVWEWVCEPIWAGLVGTLAIVAGCVLMADGATAEQRLQRRCINCLLERGYTVISPDGGAFEGPVE